MGNVFQYHNGMFTRADFENLLEIGAAYRQHDFMRLQELSLHGQCNIDHVSCFEQVMEACGQVRMEVVPSQGKLFGRGHFAETGKRWN